MCDISILIPTYHRAPALARCLESVLATRLTNVEILVSDNASPDITPQVLAGYADPRLKTWRNDSNIGGVENILKLIRSARGKWIFFVTDDDFLLPGGLEFLWQVLQENDDVGVVLSELRQQQEDGSVLPNYKFCPHAGRYRAGHEAVVNMALGAHVLSRLVFRRRLLDLEGVVPHCDSLYPQIYLAAHILKEHDGYYIDHPLVCHTVGNKVYWEYSSDYMIAARVGIYRALLSAPRWQATKKAMVGLEIKNIACGLFPLMWERGRWLAFQREIIRVPEIRGSGRYWGLVAVFLAGKIKQFGRKYPGFLKRRKKTA